MMMPVSERLVVLLLFGAERMADKTCFRSGGLTTVSWAPGSEPVPHGVRVSQRGTLRHDPPRLRAQLWHHREIRALQPDKAALLA